MTKPSIAVVIPLYNHEKFIERAIESVLHQTLAVDSIVVVDDGSRDRSVETVRGIRDSRIQLVVQENAGAHVALNRAIGIARDHAFIAILNSDDFYHPHRIERCIGFLLDHPEADVVCTKPRIVDEAGAELPAGSPQVRWNDRIWSIPEAKASLVEWLGVANFTKTTSNLAARSRYLLDHPFKPYRYLHDYYFALLCALDGKLAVLRDELLYYRVHGSNTISESTVALKKETLRMYFDVLRDLGPRLPRSPDLRAQLAQHVRVLSENMSDFRFEPFLALLAQFVATCPEPEVAAVLGALNAGQYPELVSVAQRKALKHRLDETSRERAAALEYGQLVVALARSRWIAMGRLLGAMRPLYKNPPKGTPERLEELRAKVRASGWLRAGRRLGLVSLPPGC